jgi:hypothetical protein
VSDIELRQQIEERAYERGYADGFRAGRQAQADASEQERQRAARWMEVQAQLPPGVRLLGFSGDGAWVQVSCEHVVLGGPVPWPVAKKVPVPWPLAKVDVEVAGSASSQREPGENTKGSQ